MKRPLALLGLGLVSLPGAVQAGAWTRDSGSYYLNLSYSRISAKRAFSPDFSVAPIVPYTQHVLGFYGELGIIDRWLTATVDGAILRHGSFEGQGSSYGIGDWRIGLWTGLVQRPVRLALGASLTVPLGDSRPSAGAGASPAEQLVARALPTGSGEYSVEGKLALGYSFGRFRRWPLQHHVAAEVGYWLRTRYADSFTWRAELGSRLLYPVIDRLTLILRLGGVESFASNEEASRDVTGLGNGVTYVSPGLTANVQLWRGLAVAFSFDSALRARSLPAAAQLFFAVSYQR